MDDLIKRLNNDFYRHESPSGIGHGGISTPRQRPGTPVGRSGGSVSRYFRDSQGIDTSELEKESEQLCYKCSKPGHRARECRALICGVCGAIDKHSSYRCQRYTEKCANCLQLGHSRDRCTRPLQRRYCSDCDSRLHSREMCPLIWRKYVFSDEKGVPDNSRRHAEIRKFCYSCGGSGHFGDDCPYDRATKESTAFGLANMSNYNKTDIRNHRHEQQYIRG